MRKSVVEPQVVVVNENSSPSSIEDGCDLGGRGGFFDNYEDSVDGVSDNNGGVSVSSGSGRDPSVGTARTMRRRTASTRPTSSAT